MPFDHGLVVDPEPVREARDRSLRSLSLAANGVRPSWRCRGEPVPWSLRSDDDNPPPAQSGTKQGLVPSHDCIGRLRAMPIADFCGPVSGLELHEAEYLSTSLPFMTIGEAAMQTRLLVRLLARGGSGSGLFCFAALAALSPSLHRIGPDPRNRHVRATTARRRFGRGLAGEGQPAALFSLPAGSARRS